jgi:hypothetical protein
MKMTNTIVSCDQLAFIDAQIAKDKPEVSTRDVEKAFLRAMGNGVGATKHLIHLFKIATDPSNQDVRPISNVLNRLVSDGDTTGARVVRVIFKLVFTSGMVRKAKDDTLVLSIKGDDGVVVDTDALDRLVSAEKDKLNIRDTLVNRVRGEVSKPDVTLKSVSDSSAKRAIALKASRAAFLAACAASYDAQVLEAANKAATKAK